jgi:hypothetical protein
MRNPVEADKNILSYRGFVLITNDREKKKEGGGG